MPPTIQVTESISEVPFLLTERASPPAPSRESPVTIAKLGEPSGLFLPIVTASVAAHLILVAWFGAGVPHPSARIVREVATPVTPVVVENVQVEQPETPPPELKQRVEEPVPSPDSPTPVADLDLPPLPQVQPIAAVPSSVPVGFGISINGPVRLVSDAANASGAIGGRRSNEPVTLDLEAAQNLLLPPLSYPARAKRQHVTGTVLIEFRTSPTGEIFGVRVRESSGHALLDEAAQENLRAGRWKGQPGFYVKAFEFTLQ